MTVALAYELNDFDQVGDLIRLLSLYVCVISTRRFRLYVSWIRLFSLHLRVSDFALNTVMEGVPF